MSPEELIFYLKVFGLIVFDIFFLILIVFCIYLIFVFSALKKRLFTLIDTTQNLVNTATLETENISNEIIQKVQSVNLDKVAWTGGIGSSLFLIGKSIFHKKKSSSVFTEILNTWFK